MVCFQKHVFDQYSKICSSHVYIHVFGETKISGQTHCVHTRTCADSCQSESLFLSMSGPPSPPRDLVYTLKQSTLILEWAAPSDTGGRVDLTYSLGCRRCTGRLCEACGASVGFVPQQVGLTERTVTVVNLLPNTNYTFTVEALNGVSELLPNKRFYTQVNVSTSLPGESQFDL